MRLPFPTSHTAAFIDSRELDTLPLSLPPALLLASHQRLCRFLPSNFHARPTAISAVMAASTIRRGEPSQPACESRLLALPAELRNSILRQALVECAPIRIEEPGPLAQAAWPCLADTCRQLRDEALPVFLGNNTFLVESEGLGSPPSALRTWLGRVKAVPFDTKRLIKSLTIEITRHMPRVEQDGSTVKFDLWSVKDNMQLFDLCDSLLCHISDAGLMAHQLIWPGLQQVLDALLDPQASDKVIDLLLAQCNAVHYFNTYVLSPLLRRHGIYDEHRVPVNIIAQGYVAFEGTWLHGWHDELLSGSDELDAEAQAWYWAWLARHEGLPIGEEARLHDGDDRGAGGDPSIELDLD